MATSNSNSISKSEYKRLILIGLQIKEVFDVITNESEATKNKYVEAVENRYIKSFDFYAMKCGKAYAQLSVYIDWNEYDKQMSAGKAIIKTKYPNGVLPPTKNIVFRFANYVENNAFEVKWQFTYSDHVNVAEMRRKMGTSAADEIEKSDEFVDINEYEERTFELGDYGLSEMSYKIRI